MIHTRPHGHKLQASHEALWCSSAGAYLRVKVWQCRSQGGCAACMHAHTASLLYQLHGFCFSCWHALGKTRTRGIYFRDREMRQRQSSTLPQSCKRQSQTAGDGAGTLGHSPWPAHQGQLAAAHQSPPPLRHKKWHVSGSAYFYNVWGHVSTELSLSQIFEVPENSSFLTIAVTRVRGSASHWVLEGC